MKNVFFAINTCWHASKKLTFGLLFGKIITYLNWFFFSAVFLRKIVFDLDNNCPWKDIVTWVVLAGAFFAFIAFIDNYLEAVMKPLEKTKLYKKLYEKIFNKAKNVELRCYEDAEFYDKYTKAMDGAEEKVIAVIEGIGGSVWGAIALISVFVLLFQIRPLAVLFIIFPIIGNFVFANLKNKAEFKRYQEYAPNDKQLNYVNRIMYLSDFAKEIRLTNIFNILRRQYDEATDKNVKVAKKHAFANGFNNFWKITFSFTSIFEGMLIYAVYEYLVRETISIAELTVMTSQMMAMAWILILLFNDIVAVSRNGIFINNLKYFLEYEETISEDQDGIIPESFETVEFKNVSFSYKDKEILTDLSFSINKNEMVALVGHNGAGKTTIIKLLLRLYDPSKGEILLNGQNIKNYNLRAYRDLFATTFQDFCIMGSSVKENVLMGRTFENEEKTANEALTKSGVIEKIQTLPSSINTIMTKEFDEDGVVLSGGESQKIAIARTFAKESPVKIFDEPSSALDPISEYELFQNIIQEHGNHTLVFISHRLSSVKKCNRVLMLEHGKIIEEGSHEELMRAKGKYAEMYTSQANNYLAIEK